MEHIFQSLKTLTLAIIIALGVSYVYAWTAPPSAPPNSNVSAPVNVSSTAQVKSGGLGVTAFTADSAVIPGNVAIGTAAAKTPRFYVEKSGTSDPIASFFGPGTTDNVSLTVSNAHANGSLSLFSSGSANTFLTGTVQGDTGIRRTASGKFHIGNPSGTQVTVDSAGNVGIGIASPTQKLDVVGGTKTQTLSLTPLSSAPSLSDGSLYYDSVSGRLKLKTGGAYQDIISATVSILGSDTLASNWPFTAKTATASWFTIGGSCNSGLGVCVTVYPPARGVYLISWGGSVDVTTGVSATFRVRYKDLATLKQKTITKYTIDYEVDADEDEIDGSDLLFLPKKATGFEFKLQGKVPTGSSATALAGMWLQIETIALFAD